MARPIPLEAPVIHTVFQAEGAATLDADEGLHEPRRQ
jgi:hypothetical protein